MRMFVSKDSPHQKVNEEFTTVASTLAFTLSCRRGGEKPVEDYPSPNAPRSELC
jgi:hypothetical protein